MSLEIKTIEVTLRIKTGMTDFEAASLVQQTLENSPLNNSEFCLSVEEVKTIKSEGETYDEKRITGQ